MAWRQFFDALHPKKFHRADDVLGENLCGTPDTSLPACHKPIEIGPANECRLCSKGHGRDNVASVHDPTIDVDLSIRPDSFNSRLDEPKGEGGPVELTATMI